MSWTTVGLSIWKSVGGKIYKVIVFSIRSLWMFLTTNSDWIYYLEKAFIWNGLRWPCKFLLLCLSTLRPLWYSVEASHITRIVVTFFAQYLSVMLLIAVSTTIWRSFGDKPFSSIFVVSDWNLCFGLTSVCWCLRWTSRLFTSSPATVRQLCYFFQAVRNTHTLYAVLAKPYYNMRSSTVSTAVCRWSRNKKFQL